MTPPTETRETSAGARQKERPDDYKNAAKVRLLFDRARNDAKGNYARQQRDRQDLHNLLLYRGGEDNHWSAFNTASGRYEPIPTDGPDGIPPYIRRCTTNKFATKIDGVVSVLNQSIPAKLFVPATDEDADRATAEVCEDADPVLLDEIGYQALKRRLHQLITLTDKIAFVVWYDNDPKYGSAPIEAMQCLDCGEYMTPMETGGSPVESLQAGAETDDTQPAEALDAEEAADASCPHCGSPNVTIATDPRTGIPIGVDYPKGKMCADIWSSYEFSLPTSAKIADADSVPWILGHQRLSVEEACSAWPQYADAIRKESGGTGSGHQTPLTHQYAEEMRNLSSPRAATQRGGESGTKGTVIVYRLQHDAITDDEVAFSQGLHAVMVGETLVEVQPLPIEDEHGCRRKSILLRQYADTPNTPYGKPPADDLNPLQRQRNAFEALIYLTLMLHASPKIFIPASVELVDEMTGDPWMPIRFRTTQPGDRPYLERGVSPPDSLYKSIEMTDAAMEEVSHLNSVLAGNRPEGDPTLGEVQILQERGMAAFRTPLDHLISFERNLSRMLLDLARQTAWFPRFRKVEGENGRWNVTQFTAADLQGSVDITIEPISAWPKSPSMEMVKLGKAIELGVLQPGADPEVNTKILTMLGLVHLKPSLDADRKQVAREIDRWKAAVSPEQIEPPDLAVITPAIHLFLKQQFLKTEEAEDLKRANPGVYQAMVQHVQMLNLAMMPAPTDAAPQKPAGPDGSAVQSAVNAGAIVPAGAQPQAPPALNTAVQAGALVPAAAMSAGQPTGPSIDDLLAQGAMTPAPPAPPSAP